MNWSPLTKALFGVLSRRVATSSELLHHNLLDQREFATYCGNRRLHFADSNIFDFWRRGYLIADRIDARWWPLRKHFTPTSPGFRDRWEHADDRLAQGDYPRAIDIPLRRTAKRVEPRFHPFRYHVLTCLFRRPTLHLPATFFMHGAPHLADTVASYSSAIANYYDSAAFHQARAYANAVCLLSIVSEFYSPPELFDHVLLRAHASFEERASALRREQRLVSLLFSSIGLHTLERIRGELVREAQSLEPNQAIHPLYRILPTDTRAKLEGEAGGAVLLLTMAECLRRACEAIFRRRLPEEDEIGFGTWMDGARTRVFGMARVLDTKEGHASILHNLGLARRVTTRCYVEGPTELAFIRAALGDLEEVAVVDLSGHTVAKNALLFADDLSRDRASQTFSVIVCDGDNRDLLRQLRVAARSGLLFGAVFVSVPDFELGNFSPDELCVVFNWIESNKGATHYDDVRRVVRAARSGKELEHGIRKLPGLEDFAKGEAWGRALLALLGLRYAALPPQPNDPCQLVRMLRWIRGSSRANYSSEARHYEMDPVSLSLRERE